MNLTNKNLIYPEDSQQSIIRSATGFFSGTLISRFTGMFRDIAMAIAFGTTPALAAFMVAFRFANLFRRLLGESPLTSVFVPHFEAKRRESLTIASRFYTEFFLSLITILLLFVLILESGLYAWYTYGHLSIGSLEILKLTMVMLPGLFFITLFGLNNSLLQCEGLYFLSGLAPIAFNFMWILGVLFFRRLPVEKAVCGLSFAVVIAFFSQYLLTLPKTAPFLSLKKTRLFSSDVRRLIKPFFLGLFGIGAMQINNALDPLFARYADLEGPAYLWYAIRLQQLPLAVFAISLSSALLPPLARAKKPHEMFSFLQLGLKKGVILIIPATAVLFVMGKGIIDILFGYGSFTAYASIQTKYCLWGYAIGLFPALVVLLLTQVFFAKKEYRTPMIGSLCAVFLNIVLNSFMVFILHQGAVSVAIATSLSGLANALFLLKKANLPLFNRNQSIHLFKVISCSMAGLIMTIVCKRVFLPIIPPISSKIAQQSIFLLVEGFFFLGALLIYSYLIKLNDFIDLLPIGRTRKNLD